MDCTFFSQLLTQALALQAFPPELLLDLLRPHYRFAHASLPVLFSGAPL
jgi:hypothetical protein